MRTWKFSTTLLLTAGLWLTPQPAPFLTHFIYAWSGGAYAGETPTGKSWEDEFALLISKTSMATTLSVEELQDLVERCDSIRPSIEDLEETPRKIYLKRLKKTKSLYLFIIETRKTSTP